MHYSINEPKNTEYSVVRYVTKCLWPVCLVGLLTSCGQGSGIEEGAELDEFLPEVAAALPDDVEDDIEISNTSSTGLSVADALENNPSNPSLIEALASENSPGAETDQATDSSSAAEIDVLAIELSPTVPAETSSSSEQIPSVTDLGNEPEAEIESAGESLVTAAVDVENQEESDSGNSQSSVNQNAVTQISNVEDSDSDAEIETVAEPQSQPLAVQTSDPEESPAAVEETPVVVEETPVAVEETPVVVEETPVVVEESPVVVEESPVVVEETPVAVEESPVAVEESPVAVEESPLEVIQSSNEQIIDAEENAGSEVVNFSPITDLVEAEPVESDEQSELEAVLTDLVAVPETGTNESDFRFPESQRTVSGVDPRPNFSLLDYRESASGTVNNTTLTRATSNRVFESSNGLARHAYSRRRVWNSDQSTLYIAGRLVDAETLRVDSHYVPLSGQVAWSFEKPSILFGLRSNPNRNIFAAYDIKKDSIEDLYQFSAYERCSIGDSKGDVSLGDRRVALVCEKDNDSSVYVVSFSIENREVLGTRKFDSNLKWAGFTNNGDYILVQQRKSSGGGDELLRFSSSLSNEFLLTNELEHGDMGFDEDGNQVYVMIAWDYIYYVEIETGDQVNLQVSDQDNPIGFGHISCRSTERPGWCFFSSKEESRMGAVKIGRDGNQQIVDGRGRSVYKGLSEIEIWGFHRSSYENYDSQPKISANPTGTKAFYTSDWYGKGEINSYRIEYKQ